MNEFKHKSHPFCIILQGDSMFRLKELREENGMKRSELARALNINAGTIANYENEIRQAPYEYLVLFAKFFDVSVDYLLGTDVSEKIANPLSGALTENERKLLLIYRGSEPAVKRRIIEYAELWKSRNDLAAK